MMHRRIHILCGLFLLIPMGIRAQDNSKDLDKVDIYTKYKPVLSDARKVETQPELRDPDTRELKLVYSFPDLRYKVQPAFTPIGSQPYRAVAAPPGYNNFLKVGFGNYTTPLVHLDLHNNKNEKYAYGLNAFHLSSTGKPEYKTFMDDRLQIHGARFINGNTLSGQLSYNRNSFFYYGYDHEKYSFNRDSVRQTFHLVNGNVHFDNSNSGKKLKISSDGDFYHFSKKDQNETGYRLSASGNHKIGNGTFSAGLGFEGFVSGPDTVKYQRNFIDIHPAYRLKYQDVDISIGAIATILLDSNTKKFFLYPDFRAEYYLVPEKLKAYAGINGGLSRGSVRALYYENPFLADYQPIRNANTSYRIYGGIKGKLGKGFDYNLDFSQQFIHDLALYVSDTFPLNKFLVLYDDVNLFKFQAGLNYTRFDKVNIGTTFTYFAYDGDALHAYQRPDFEWTTRISVKVTPKVGLHAKANMIGTRYALTKGALQSEKLKPIADLNFGADFALRKNFYLFADLNNLTNQTYQRWLNYPVYGFNGVAGITYSF